MPTQDFNIYTRNGYAGDLVDSGPRTVGTGVLVGGDAGFGVAMSRNTTVERGVELGGSGNIYAISQREYNHEAGTRPSTGTDFKYRETESVSLIREGYIYIEVTGRAVVEGAKLNTVTATGEFTGGTAGAGEAVTLNVTAEEAGQVGDVIKARIDIYNA